MRLRWRAWLNRIRDKPRRQILPLGLKIGLPLLSFWLMTSLFRGWLKHSPGAAAGGLAWMLFGIVLLPIVRNPQRVINMLFLAQDLAILLSAPLRASFVFGYRIVSLLWESRMTFLVGLSATSAYGVATGAPPAYFLVQVILIFLLLMFMNAFLTLILLGAIRGVPPEKVRSAVLVLGTIMGGAIAIGIQVAAGWLLPSAMRSFPGAPAGFGERLVTAGWLPSSWVFQALTRMGVGDASIAWLVIGGLLAGSLAFLSGAFGFFASSHEAVYVRLQESSGGAARVRPRSRLRHIAQRVIRPDILALIAKDWKTIYRDPSALIQIAISVTVLLVWGLSVALRGQDSASPGRVGHLVPIFIGVFLMTGGMTMRMVRSDAAYLPMLRASPLGMRRFLLAKTLSALPLVLFTGIVPLVILLVRFIGGISVALPLVLTAVCLWASTLITVSVAATGPPNDVGDPSFNGGFPARVGGVVTRAFFLGSTLLILLSVSPRQGGMTESGIALLSRPGATWLIGIAGLLLSLLALFALVGYGAYRLERLDKE